MGREAEIHCIITSYYKSCGILAGLYDRCAGLFARKQPQQLRNRIGFLPGSLYCNSVYEQPLYYDRIGTDCIYDMCQHGNQPDWPLYFECSRCNDRTLDSCSGSDNSFDDGHWRIQSAGHDQNVLASHNYHLRLGRGLDYDDLSCLIFQEYEKGYCHALYFNQNLLTISQTKLR